MSEQCKAWQGGKLLGCVSPVDKPKPFKFQVEWEGKRFNKSFRTREEAELCQMEFCKDKPLMNQWREYDVNSIEMRVGEKTVLFDKEDADKVLSHVWSLRKHKVGNYYTRANVTIDGKKTTIMMHRLVTNFQWETVDHIDHDTLDNRKHNLRDGGHDVNQRNCIKGSNYTNEHQGISKIVRGKSTFWKFHWSEDGKRRSKSFKITDGNENAALNSAIEFKRVVYNRIGNTNGMVTRNDVEQYIQNKRQRTC